MKEIMRQLYALLFSTLAASLMAQPVLLPSIGMDVLPADDEPICPLPFQTPPINSTGYFVGDTAADLRLYDRSGNAFQLSGVLAAGRPVLMVAGSWTCPVFRNGLGHLEQMKALYGDQLEVIIVYTAEAHPSVDLSPYFGAVNPGAANISAGILFQQPTTYGARRDLVDAMLDSMPLNTPVYLDGPCNAWWHHYGPAPNNAYLIGTDGLIAVKHGWYNKFPQDMECDIRGYLGLPDMGCGVQEFGGSFTYQLMSNDTVTGTSGATLTITALLSNPTTLPVQVRVVRLQENVPSGWGGSLCLDLCYLPEVDTALVVIPAGGGQLFHYYFYSDATAALGHVRIGFRNEEDHSNSALRNYWGITSGGVGQPEVAAVAAGFALAPNPAIGPVRIVTDQVWDRALILDAAGRQVLEWWPGTAADVSALSSGVHILRLQQGGAWIPGAVRLVVP